MDKIGVQFFQDELEQSEQVLTVELAEQTRPCPPRLRNRNEANKGSSAACWLHPRSSGKAAPSAVWPVPRRALPNAFLS